MENPNFRFNSVIQEMDCCFGINDIFEIYYDQNNNNELHLICPSENYSIKVIRLKDNQLIKTLVGHTGKITLIRRFYNNINKKDYLISSGKKSEVKIWDLSDNFNLLFSLKINYSENTCIYSCALFFSENKGNYLITSSNENSDEDYTKIYDFNTQKLIANLDVTNQIEIFYMLLWENESKNYLIESSIGRILIHNLENKQLFHILNAPYRSTQNSMCLIKNPEINKVDLLCVTTIHGSLDFWDLGTFTLKFSIKYKSSYFYDIINWFDKFVIVAEKFNSSIVIVDLIQRKLISVIKNKNNSYVISLKQIIHPKFGQSLLSSDLNKNIVLWAH